MGVEARKPRVLIVDDEVAVGRAVGRSLSRAFECVIVTSVREALARVASGEGIDAVVTDFTMPEMSGADLYDALLAAGSRLVARMIFVTGSVGDPMFEQFCARVKLPIIPKPFDPVELRRVLTQMIGGDPASPE